MNPDKRIRRLQNLLYTSGIGTILFSIWSGIRGIVTFFSSAQDYPLENMDETTIFTIKLILNVFIIFIFFLIILINLYIGKTAISISLGKSCRFRFIFLSLLYFASTIMMYVYVYIINQTPLTIQLQDVAMAVLDLTASIILIEVILFSIKLNRLRANVCK